MYPRTWLALRGTYGFFFYFSRMLVEIQWLCNLNTRFRFPHSTQFAFPFAFPPILTFRILWTVLILRSPWIFPYTILFNNLRSHVEFPSSCWCVRSLVPVIRTESLRYQFIQFLWKRRPSLPDPIHPPTAHLRANPVRLPNPSPSFFLITSKNNLTKNTHEILAINKHTQPSFPNQVRNVLMISIIYTASHCPLLWFGFDVLTLNPRESKPKPIDVNISVVGRRRLRPLRGLL